MQQPSSPPSNPSPQSVGGRSGVRRVILPALALAALCLVVYFPLHRAGFFWDDLYWIVNNPFLRHWSGLVKIWFQPDTFLQYYPLTTTGFLLQWMVWGPHPLGYHVVSLLLQIFNAILLWRLLLRLRFRAAWMMAAIFAIHPVVVESVAWVVEQKNLLSGALVLMAVWAWVRFTALDHSDEGLQRAPPALDWKFYWLATVLYLLALLAKTYVCALPAAILVLTWWKTGRLSTKHILASGPWFGLTVAAGLMAIWRERTGAGAMGSYFHFSIRQHLIIAGKDLWFYPAKLLWPHPILSIYPRWHIRHFSTLDLIYPLAAALVGVVLFAGCRRIGRGPAAAAAIYAIMVSPSLGFFAFSGMSSTFVTDHYFYLGCISLIVLGVQWVDGLLRRTTVPAPSISSTTASHSVRRGVAMAAGCSVLLVLGILSFRRSMNYRSVKAIWAQELRYNKDCPAAYDNLGAMALDAGHYQKAIALAEHGYSLAPAMDVVGSGIIGAGLMHLHKYQQAITWLRRSLGPDPYYPTAIAQIAYCYEQIGNVKMAMKDLHRGLTLMPHSATLLAALGQALERQGQLQSAIAAFQRALHYAPNRPRYHMLLAIALEQTGQWPKAIRQYQAATDMAPDLVQARFLLGRCLLRHGHPQAAISEFQTVIQIAGAYPGAYRLLDKARELASAAQRAAPQAQR
ncbi:MAG: tetratricopeptide repeat protein [Planctomycetia bacterium]|jgi:tetratricopeptide (TPR) repeat protein|nr:tetratricopeptide repeat protein [Planctomycetia bacterium]